MKDITQLDEFYLYKAKLKTENFSFTNQIIKTLYGQRKNFQEICLVI